MGGDMPCGALVGPAWELSDDTIHPFGLGVLACLFDWLGRVNMAHGVFITRVGHVEGGGPDRQPDDLLEWVGAVPTHQYRSGERAENRCRWFYWILCGLKINQPTYPCYLTCVGLWSIRFVMHGSGMASHVGI